MPLNSNRVRQHLKDFNFKTLFREELGWDRHKSQLDVTIDNQAFVLTAVAEKRGMVVYICSPLADGQIPDRPTRLKIERKVARSVHEHIIIYINSQETDQYWQWVKREIGRPAACRDHHYHHNQPGDSLVQKLELIAFSLKEEETLTLVDVAGRTRTAFDVERVTRRFYDRFKAEHGKFLEFIKGIPDEEEQRWYASVMLNRLMFIYFIQKKGFLDDDSDYLRNKLAESKKGGKNRFYSHFLCPLFFEGFAKKEEKRSAKSNKLLGKVPYLNGGIFQRHQIEERHGKRLKIPDSAFEKLFNFFEEYHWHLDERPLRDDNEINPDVLGYIFEKYINQRQMGAYYSKEDITGYIGQNTVIPFLFDAAKKKCKIAFEGEHTVWQLLQADPDRYIYDAVKKGAELPLPKDIAAGINDVAKRTEWNTLAPSEYALPTEIWREVVARRMRYEEVRAKLANGEIRDINDLITFNLDIRQFARDVIEDCEGPELLRAFWHAIQEVTVLDPTCGSGAFLFAALNILEDLYEACLDRMEVFLDELQHSGEKHRPEKYSDFRKVLERIELHPNRDYFIFKSIIVNNLYGVDIMDEAIEICKLRLFLKLVAQVERIERIEPLPDIDFNIQAGNTLVGFTSLDSVRDAMSIIDGEKSDTKQKRMLYAEEEAALISIEEEAEDIDRLFRAFRKQQTEVGGDVTPSDKQELRKRLKNLEGKLNRHLATEYGVSSQKGKDYQAWLKSHKPFHWFIEFYGILKKGGFDAIVGNPPYVEYKNTRHVYEVRQFSTESCGDLYAFVMERSDSLLATGGWMGMIVPVSITSTDKFDGLRQHLCKAGRSCWCLGFAERPAKLFTGVEKRLTIWLMARSSSGAPLLASNYRRWFSEERGDLFSKARFVDKGDVPDLVNSSIPKVATPIEIQILQKLSSQACMNSFFLNQSTNIVYYTRKVRYFIQFFDFIPEIRDGKGRRLEPSELKMLYLRTSWQRNVSLAVLNSGLFFWFFCTYSDVRNVNRREIRMFPCSLDEMDGEVTKKLQGLSKKLMEDLKRHAKTLTGNYGSHGQRSIQTFQPRMSKPVIDEIDQILARHYGFTEEESDFIVNYDVKYRMGLGSD